MATEHLIAANDFCVYHEVEYTFIDSLQNAGLVEVTIVDNNMFIPDHELPKLERMIRLHQELDINVPGIEAISHLLQRLDDLQKRAIMLKNQLKMYEGE